MTTFTAPTITAVIPGPGTVADAARFYATGHSAPEYADADVYELATAHAYRLASAYPVAPNAVEVAISPEAVAYAVSEYVDLLTADSIAESAATVMLDMAAERAGVTDGLITTVAPGVLRLTW